MNSPLPSGVRVLLLALLYNGFMPDLEIVPTTALIGAEIRGLDLGKPLEAHTVKALENALHQHLVLFFRDQKVGPAEHIAFARHFGEIQLAPFGPKDPDYPAITVLDQVNPSGQGADRWHTDNTYMPNPPMGSILRGVQLPSVGGGHLLCEHHRGLRGALPGDAALRRRPPGRARPHPHTQPCDSRRP